MNSITSALAQLSLGCPQQHRNLTLFPLLSQTQTIPDYWVLDQALAQKTALVTEVSIDGSVPELQFINQGDQAVLLLDGEELIGAKQNRVLNLTLLVSGRTSLKIPVSCVESGRWQHLSPEFATSPRAYYSSGRAKKIAQVSASLAQEGRRRSDQSEVWNDIAQKAQRMNSRSPTQAMAAMYEQHHGLIEDYVAALSVVPNQVGAIFAIAGLIIGLDTFDHAATLSQLFPKLVRSYALDALDSPIQSVIPCSQEATAAFLRGIGKCKVEVFPALGEGVDMRLSSAEIVGSALLARERVVHLSAFRQHPPQSDTSGALQRPSRRRQHTPRFP